MSAQRNQQKMPIRSSMILKQDSTPILENRRGAGLLSKRQIKGGGRPQNNEVTPIIDIQTVTGTAYKNDKIRPQTGKPSYFQLAKSQGNSPKTSITRVFSANHLSPK